MYNEIFPPIIQKNATIEPNERSIFQLLELYAEDMKGMPKNLKQLFYQNVVYLCIWKS